jgi:hypothetical protein
MMMPSSSSWNSQPHPHAHLVHRVGSQMTDGNETWNTMSLDDHDHHAQIVSTEQPWTPTRRLSTPSGTFEDSPFSSSHGTAAASVLLLAASKIRQDEEASAATISPFSNDDNSSKEVLRQTPSQPSVPLKKRKNPADIMRQKTEIATASVHSQSHAHVSPMSHNDMHQPSSSESVATTSPDSISSRHPPSSPSYELQDGQALLDSAKIHDTKEITLPTSSQQRPPPASMPSMMIPHFPSILHAVLTESEFANSVVQWLAHGQAWKIVRWDALRRQVLTKYFAPHGLVSMDAFMWQLQAWGFMEVTDGPDVGAYANVVRCG